jgi:hypothetical protein
VRRRICQNVQIEWETGSNTNTKIARYLNILDAFMQEENFYQQIPEAKVILKMLYEA